MRTVKINHLTQFLKANSPVMKERSNNFIRSWVHFRLASNNLYLIFKGKDIAGCIEWYRYQTVQDLIETFKKNRLSGNAGPVLFVNSITSNKTSIPSGCDKQAYKKFISYQRGVGDIAVFYRLTYKNHKFGHKRII